MICIVAVSLSASAQIWKKPQQAARNEATATTEKKKKADPDKAYLAGAVPEVDGKVVFQRTIDAPGKNAQAVYELLLQKLQEMTAATNMPKSQVAIVNEETREIIASFEEWLVFKQTALITDRTRFYYTVHATCHDGSADVSVIRLHYFYEEERDPQRMTAEEWISDKAALNKKGTKLLPLSGKFRRKTIDRMQALLNELADTLK